MILIRDVSLFPLHEVYHLMKSIYESTDYMSQSFEEKYPTFESFLEDVKKHALETSKGSFFLIAQEGARLLGYARIEPRTSRRLSHTADLSMGCVSDARGKGVGRLLLTRLLQKAGEYGVTEILYLHVRCDNASALHLYEQLHFEKIGLLPDDTRLRGHSYDVCLMRKVIPRAGASKSHGHTGP